MDPSRRKGPDRVPPVLKKVLDLDAKVTKKFVDGVERALPVVRSSTGANYMKALEVLKASLSQLLL
jgi:lipoate synthase